MKAANTLETAPLVYDVILSRRTIREFLPDPVPKEALKRIIQAGTWAPNHRLTEPWRFVIVGAKTRRELVEAMVRQILASGQNHESLRQVRQSLQRKMLSQPVLIAVTCIQSGNEIQQSEDLAAVCAAIQNMQLAAWAEGVGSQWITGRPLRLIETDTLLELSKRHERVVGFLYLGYPASVPGAHRRRGIRQLVRTLP